MSNLSSLEVAIDEIKKLKDSFNTQEGIDQFDGLDSMECADMAIDLALKILSQVTEVTELRTENKKLKDKMDSVKDKVINMLPEFGRSIYYHNIFGDEVVN